MIIGIPKEIKNNENRVGMTPAGVAELVKHGHLVFVQHTAGEGSGFSDEEYAKAGARILDTILDVYRESEMIVKVKEPIKEEYPLIKSEQILFTYFHFASDEELLLAMLENQAICVAYETVEAEDGSLPLLKPMSVVAGKMAALNGAYYLQKTKGGKGKLIGGMEGVKPAKVLVLGGGTVGHAAAELAANMGAEVYIADINEQRLSQLKASMSGNVHTLISSEENIRKEITNADVIIGSVLVKGDKTPHLITKDMLKDMEKGTVLVDVAIDQGGCFETSRPTTHSEPTYEIDGIVHYAVTNIPGAVPNSSTIALTNATLPYVLAIADKGINQAMEDDPGIRKGLNSRGEHITYQALIDLFGYKSLYDRKKKMEK